jgi:hypothetical protein
METMWGTELHLPFSLSSSVPSRKFLILHGCPQAPINLWYGLRLHLSHSLHECLKRFIDQDVLESQLIVCLILCHRCFAHTFCSVQFNSIYSCSIISTTGKVTSQIKSCTSHCAAIKYKQISMKLDTHYIYIYINSNHQNVTSIKHITQT